jgi:hypothetical protein
MISRILARREVVNMHPTPCPVDAVVVSWCDIMLKIQALLRWNATAWWRTVRLKRRKAGFESEAMTFLPHIFEFCARWVWAYIVCGKGLANLRRGILPVWCGKQAKACPWKMVSDSGVYFFIEFHSINAVFYWHFFKNQNTLFDPPITARNGQRIQGTKLTVPS